MSDPHAGPTKVTTSPIEVTQQLIDRIVGTGGYTHPLFNPTAEQRASGAAAPLPGQGILLLMGGLLEQSGALDHAIALVELKNAKFAQMVSAGTVMSVELQTLDSRITSAGKLIQNYRWTAVDQAGVVLVEVCAVMLMHPEASLERSVDQ